MSPLLITAIVVDDELSSRRLLTTYLHECCLNVSVVDECATVEDAYNSINSNKPHVVFLDVRMSNESGLDLLRRFKILSFKVIFVSGYSKYALQAFRFAATDFLSKPVSIIELQEAVGRVRKELSVENSNVDETVGSCRFGRLVIPDTQGFKVVCVSEIIMCKADSYCTYFFLKNEKSVMSTYHLKHYEKFLPKQEFMRIHKSYIVNIKHVQGLQNNLILLSNKLSCPLGAKYREKFKALFVNVE